MPDIRTKRQKIEDWLKPNSGKTEEEKEIARAMLAKMPADPVKLRPPSTGANYEPPTGEAARPAGRQYQYRAYRDPNAGPDDPLWVDSDFFDGVNVRSFSEGLGRMSEEMREFLDTAFNRVEQAAIKRYMAGNISKEELEEVLRKNRGWHDGS